MTIHRDLPEAHLHEPKNMSTATAGAADIGKVIVAKGDGSTEVRLLKTSEIDQSTNQYGEHDITGNSTVIAMTAAVDSTLATNTDYVQVAGIWDAVPHGDINGMTHDTEGLTATVAGVYEVHIWLGAKSSINSTVVAFKFAVDGAIALVRRPKSFLRNAGEIHNLSAHGFVTLAAAQAVTLYMASSTTADITIEDCVFSLHLIRRT